MSNLDLKQAHATPWQIVSFSGKGVTSFLVLLFCCLRSNKVCNVQLFFGIHSIGVAHLSAAGIHDPAVVYCSIFQAISGWNASGHLGNLCLSCFDSSMKGILWRTSCSGGNSTWSGSNRALNNPAISSWIWGISLSVYTHRFLIPKIYRMGNQLFFYFYFQHMFSINSTVVNRQSQR